MQTIGSKKAFLILLVFLFRLIDYFGLEGTFIGHVVQMEICDFFLASRQLAASDY